MHFTIRGRINEIEVIAIGKTIRELRRLRRRYGAARWRKMKGIASVELEDGSIRLVELHWYEAHGLGRYEYKIKAYLD